MNCSEMVKYENSHILDHDISSPRVGAGVSLLQIERLQSIAPRPEQQMSWLRNLAL